MSEFRVEVVEIGEIEKHPNADTLSKTMVLGGYPVLFKTGQFRPGDKAVYVSVDALVPLGREEFKFLDDGCGKSRMRVRAKKLRGIFSMGLLIPAPAGVEVGTSLIDEFGVEKYLPASEREVLGGDAESPPLAGIPHYDLESIRKCRSFFRHGEEVVVTEKLHGTNARFVYHNGRLYCSSRKFFRKFREDSAWWRIAKKYELEHKLSGRPDFVFFGEVFGKGIQDLSYGTDSPIFNVFDIWDSADKRWLNWEEVKSMCAALKLETVPVLTTGPYDEEKIFALAEGKSSMANHVREGVVVRAPIERFDHEHQTRSVLKLVGQGYMLRG